MNKKFLRKKIPSFFGVLVLVLGLAAGVFLIGQQQIFRLGATGDLSPKDVRLSNISDSSITVSWITKRDAIGYISWGSTVSLGQLARQQDTSPKKIHSVTLKGLSPLVNYYFTINSGGEEFDNGGIPWTQQTGPKLAPPSGTMLAAGTVLDANGRGAPNVLVYINGGGVSQLSATTSSGGAWTIPLSLARNRTLTSHATIEQSSILDIFVQGGAQGVASAQVVASRVNPAPDITLGQTYDFRNNVAGKANLPEANVLLPGQEEEEPLGPGGFDISGESLDEQIQVTLESIEEPGEVIFVPNPEFFGKGPSGTPITITIESDPITGTARVNSGGQWRWSPPENLPDGTHSITIKWTDINGILRSLTRTFVVKAAEGDPGFESTPSGQTTPAPTATPTLSPTPTPTPTPTPSPTRASIPSTESGIPAAGNLTPTLILITIGLGLFISGIVISRRGVL